MTDQSNSINEDSRGAIQWLSDYLFCLACGLIVGVFAWFADTSAPLETVFSSVNQDNYNLLAQGFSSGQLNLKEDAPPGLAKLSDPYDPNLNAPFLGGPIDDLTYYKGKLYLYFGVTPALVFFWPYYALTGHYLSEKEAVAFFVGLGFAAIAGILRAARRRYFPETGKWIAVAGTILPGLALALTLPVNVHETAIACGFAFAMLALAAVWAALHETKRRGLWLALASLAYGLAIGARPDLLFGAIILLLPVIQAWRQLSGRADLPVRRAELQPAGQRLRRLLALLLAATGPITCIGLGLLLYNLLRFNNPFEFGLHYQLSTSYRAPSVRLVSLSYFWFNFRLYFLEPFVWSGQFPFLKTPALPPMPPGYDLGNAYTGGGILIIYPIVFLAAALAWKRKLAGPGSALAWFAAACLFLFMGGAVTISLYFAAQNNYELDFLPGLLLLALIGTFCADQAALPFPGRRRLICLGWFVLMSYSVAFNILTNVETRAENHFFLGNYFVSQGRLDEAKAQYQKTLLLDPESADAYGGLGNLLFNQNRLDEAIVDYQKALEINPNFVEAQNNIGYCFLEKGRVDDAIAHYEIAVELRPQFAKYRSGLGNALCQKGLFDDAIAQYQKALAIQPDSADIHERIGDALFRKGELGDAVIQYQAVVKLQPGFVQAHNNLAYCLQQIGRTDEAIAQYRKAIELEPGFAQAYNNLGNAYRQKGMANQACDCYEKAVELAPEFLPAQLNLAWMLATWPDAGVRNGDKAVALAKRLNDMSHGNDPKILRTLAAAYAETGRFTEASSTAKQALALALAESQTTLTNALQTELTLYLAHSPSRSTGNL